MPSLDPTLRKLLENKVPAARQAAEEAAGAILTSLAVNRPEPFPKMTTEQRTLRNALRARARQLGEGSQTEGYQPLLEELAYTQWHRMVFARFLAENNLLMHPSGVAVTLADCAELAPEEGELDGWAVAARYAGAMLPGIFRPEDPESGVRLAPEGQQSLEAILNALPQAVFVADDALGWMYQFWQSKKKDEINKSERKIGGKDIAPVTQLFTEDYMVRFLLENTLGAWWAARHPHSPLIREWEYLRWKEPSPDLPLPTPAASAPWRGQGERTEPPDDSLLPLPLGEGRVRVEPADSQFPSPSQGEGLGVRVEPAAGTFPGWPERAAEVTVMDPCCGSGHFLVAAFEMLVKMRMEEEGLSEAQAAEAALRDNLFGLEIDPRCTQIAAFALALSAWKRGGWRPLPEINVACSGIPVQGQLDDWLKLAGEDGRVRAGLERLYHLFEHAPELGSLIQPADLPDADRLFVADYEQVLPVLLKALSENNETTDFINTSFKATTQGVIKASLLLAQKYKLVITNVPYLGTARQNENLKRYIRTNFYDARYDLATVFIERCRQLCAHNGTYTVVSPNNWFFLKSYTGFRTRLLGTQKWSLLVRLGTGAFSTVSGEIVNVTLLILNNQPPRENMVMTLDLSISKESSEKEHHIKIEVLREMNQSDFLKNPDSRIATEELKSNLSPLSIYADSYWGIGTGDGVRFGRQFWEIPQINSDWNFFQGTFSSTQEYTGRDLIIFWQDGKGDLYQLAEELKLRLKNIWQRGSQAWGKSGVLISQMGDLYATRYSGEIFQNGTATIIPKKQEDLPAIWAYCSSKQFSKDVRKIDQSLCVTNATLIKVPFDLEHWRKVAEAAGPLPEPHSDDPTQWLFMGHPKGSEAPLQVALARLLGYRWPQQPADNLDGLADGDGILCLPAVSGEAPLADRLRALLAQAYGEQWSPQRQSELLAQAGSPGKPLEEWLRDDFFPQHCRLFHNRPFLWHIWDGRKDGFSALVNYHSLTKANLERLIFVYLGDWINFQRSRRDHGEPGADGRLVAALALQEKLKAILVGEPPQDIYVRWKPLAKQPIGWDPDLNDGVRLNIRPFVQAGVLRSKFTINWNKDRGKIPDGSERLNDLHYTIAEKKKARGG